MEKIITNDDVRELVEGLSREDLNVYYAEMLRLKTAKKKITNDIKLSLIRVLNHSHLN